MNPSPDAIENEGELNEYAAEGQKATHHHAGQKASVHRLVRNLTRDLVCACWVLNWLQDEGKQRGFNLFMIHVDETKNCTFD